MNFNSNDKIENSTISDEIDLKKLVDTLIRNKKSIGICGLTGLFIGGLIAFNTKRVWQGEFQIVLDSPSSDSIGNSLSISSSFADLAGFRPTSSNPLKTEVEILKSPSVLMNVFEFVKSQRELNNQKSERLRFSSWKKNLDIGLEKGTSVLNITYEDKNKQMIVPTLRRISRTYQEYSGSNRLRQIDLSVNYFRDQISIYKDKSIQSQKNAQQFAIDHDLSVLQARSESEVQLPNVINIESIRVRAANEIRYIDQQLEKVKELEFDSDEIRYFTSTIPSLVELYSRVRDIEFTLAEARQSYKENDITVKNLIKQKNSAIKFLKEEITGVLLANKVDAQARLNSSERPKGVLIKYKELVNNVIRDKETLEKLENNYRAILLEKARIEDPWKLITKPILLPFPIAPNRKNILALGLISGSLLGIGGVLINEKRKDIIYSVDEIKTFCNWPLIANLTTPKDKSWDEFFHLMSSGSLQSDDSNIVLLALDKIDEKLVSEIKKGFYKVSNDYKLDIVNDIIGLSGYTSTILIVSLGITKKEELIKLEKKLLLNKKKILGILSLS